MKLEHLIQGYKFNRISVMIDREINEKEERAGVLKFNDDITASYLLDNEGIVIAMNLFSNCVVAHNKTMDKQLKHTTNTLTIIQKTIQLIGNTKQEEANSILKQLGLFSGNIKAKAVRFTNHIYKIDTANGLLVFSMLEEGLEDNKTVRSGNIKKNK